MNKFRFAYPSNARKGDPPAYICLDKRELKQQMGMLAWDLQCTTLKESPALQTFEQLVARSTQFQSTKDYLVQAKKKLESDIEKVKGYIADKEAHIRRLKMSVKYGAAVAVVGAFFSFGATLAAGAVGAGAVAATIVLLTSQKDVLCKDLEKLMAKQKAGDYQKEVARIEKERKQFLKFVQTLQRQYIVDSD